jgi:hypothetical protein
MYPEYILLLPKRPVKEKALSRKGMQKNGEMQTSQIGGAAKIELHT